MAYKQRCYHKGPNLWESGVEKEESGVLWLHHPIDMSVRLRGNFGERSAHPPAHPFQEHNSLSPSYTHTEHPPTALLDCVHCVIIQMSNWAIFPLNRFVSNDGTEGSRHTSTHCLSHDHADISCHLMSVLNYVMWSSCCSVMKYSNAPSLQWT